MLASTVKLSGTSLIGSRQAPGMGEPHYATDPTTGASASNQGLTPTEEDIELAVQLSADAFPIYRRTSPRERAAFLRRIAEKIEAIAPDIIERAGKETALPAARLQGGTARTCGQLRLFAQVAEEGSWVNARIDLAMRIVNLSPNLISDPCFIRRARSCLRCEATFPSGRFKLQVEIRRPHWRAAIPSS